MEFIIELSDGREVKLVEVWNCCSGTEDCGNSIDVYDAETNELLCSLKGLALPDIDDEDFDINSYAEFIESKMDEQESYLLNKFNR